MEHDDVDASLKKLYKRDGYLRATQKWWDTWANSEQAVYFSPTDWERLQMVAVLVDQFFGTGRQNKSILMAEIRQNETLLGATIMDRMRMRMAANKAPAAAPKDSSYEDDDALYKDLGG